MQIQSTGSFSTQASRLSAQQRGGESDAAASMLSAQPQAASFDAVNWSADAQAYLERPKDAALQQTSGLTAEALESAAEAQSSAVSETEASEPPVVSERQRTASRVTQAELDSLRQQAISANEQAKAQAEEMEQKLKCLKIANNLISGKQVPLQDLQYLQKHDQTTYAKALTLRCAAVLSREKAKRVTSDEDFEESSAATALEPASNLDAAGALPSEALVEAQSEAAPE